MLVHSSGLFTMYWLQIWASDRKVVSSHLGLAMLSLLGHWANSLTFLWSVLSCLNLDFPLTLGKMFYLEDGWIGWLWGTRCVRRLFDHLYQLTEEKRFCTMPRTCAYTATFGSLSKLFHLQFLSFVLCQSLPLIHIWKDVLSWRWMD